MINLLPQNDKKQARAGRVNGLLVRYNVILIGCVAFLGLAVGVTYIYLSNTKAAAEKTITDNQSKVASYAAVQTQAQQFRTNLTTAKQILGNEVTYTKVILEIAQLLPAGVVLQNLNLDSQTFGTETTLVAQAKSYDDALSLKDAFGKSTLFKDVHFKSITTDATTTTPSDYPFTINLSVTIMKEVAKQ